MLQSIRFRGYKSFKAWAQIDLHPITVLVGPNSSGKSAIMGLLSLLRQSYGHGAEGSLLRYRGPDVEMHSFETISHQRKAEPIQIHLEATAIWSPYDLFSNESLSGYVKGQTTAIELTLDNDGGSVESEEYTYEQVGDYVRTEVGPEVLLADIRRVLTPATEALFKKILALCDSVKPQSVRIERLLSPWSRIELPLDGLRALKFGSYGKFKWAVYEGRENAWDEYWGPPIRVKNEVPGLWEKHLQEEVYDELPSFLFVDLESNNEPVDTVGALQVALGVARKAAQGGDSVALRVIKFYLLRELAHMLEVQDSDALVRAYHKMNSVDLTLDGALNSIRSIGPIRQVPVGSFSEASIEEWVESGGGAFPIEPLNESLKTIGIRYEVVLVRLTESELFPQHFALAFRDLESGLLLNFPEVGFGLSQVLPVLLAANTPLTRVSPRRVYAIQQPELHLHPYSQARLARMFADRVEFEGNIFSNIGYTARTFLLETHSEYLVRGLQVEISQRRIPVDYVAIYYVGRRKNGNSYVKRLRLDEHGQFVDEWPEGFFDQSYKQAMQIVARLD